MSKRIYSLQWSAVENAQTYRVFRSLTEVGNKQELVLTSNRSLELNQYIPGSSDYYYFIKAQATGYQDSDYSTPLRWKTFSISRSVDTGVIETTDDSFVGEGFGYNTGFVAPGGKIFNRAVCLLTIGGIQHPEYISFLTDDKAFNIDIPAEAVTGDIVYSAVVQDEITQLATPAIAMNADGKTLEITDVENATSYDVYVDGTMKTNVASVPNTTTVDLSTLSDIADGTHTVKAKAKAEGYNDSEFSNEVSYTKATPIPTYSIFFEGETSDFTLKATNKEWNGTVEYSTDKNTWNTWDGSEISSASKKLYLRGKNNTKFYTSNGVRFVLSAKAGCYGNINALLDYENPPTTLASGCYSHMFQGCSLLTTAPELPATTLAESCYSYMFQDCTSLATAPALPATMLTVACYQYMFYGCTSLTTSPALPATTLAESCYQYMFRGCTSLNTAPALPSTTLAKSCYNGMFRGCASLKISDTRTGEYTTAWRIPSSGNITSEEYYWNNSMLSGTGGTFTGNPTRNTTYYGAW